MVTFQTIATRHAYRIGREGRVVTPAELYVETMGSAMVAGTLADDLWRAYEDGFIGDDS